MTDEGKVHATTHFRATETHSPLIRRLRATFPLRGRLLINVKGGPPLIKVEELFIEPTATVLETLRKLDETGQRILFIAPEGKLKAVQKR